MSKKRKIAGVIIDILMFTDLLLQMFYVFTGNIMHEILGMAFFALLVGHLIIKKWWFNIRRKFRPVFDLVTIAIILVTIALALTSMGVSRFLFPDVKLFASPTLHKYLATALLALSTFHGGLHMVYRSKKKTRAKVLLGLMTAAAASVGLFLVPYLNRHYLTVETDYRQAVEGEKAALSKKTKIVYFTRIGNTDFEPDVDAVSGASLLLADGKLMGNTQLMADMLEDITGASKDAITLVKKKYPSSYMDTCMDAKEEMDAKDYPEIVPIDVTEYEDIFLVYPIWWGTIPLPVEQFLRENDFTGKTIHLFATQGSAGFVSSTKDIKKLVPNAEVVEALSIYCDDIPTCREDLLEYLN